MTDIRITNLTEFEKYVTETEDLKRINGDCDNCPIRKKCEKANHYERLHGIIDSPIENTSHPAITKMIQRFSFILYMIPKSVFKKWSGYHNGPLSLLGCPSRNIVNNLEKIRCVYNMLTDNNSKSTFISVLMYRLTFDDVYLKNVYSTQNEYFEFFNGLDDEEVVVDCGGFIGDTLDEYLYYNKVPRKYIIFEPSKSNIERLKKHIIDIGAEEYTVIFEKGVGKEKETKYIELENGMATELTLNGEDSLYSVDIETIDSLYEEEVSFIKMDIEGAELDAIKGAQKTINEKTPKLAICLYHKPSDLFDIPLLIKSLSDEYNNFIIRHYHKYSFTETILYVWKKN